MQTTTEPDARLAACLLRHRPRLREVQQASAPSEDILFTAVDERTGRMMATGYTYAELQAALADDAEALDAIATVRAYTALDPALTVIVAGLVTAAGQTSTVVAALNLQDGKNAARNCDLIFSLSCSGRTTIDSKRQKCHTRCRDPATLKIDCSEPSHE